MPCCSVTGTQFCLRLPMICTQMLAAIVYYTPLEGSLPTMLLSVRRLMLLCIVKLSVTCFVLMSCVAVSVA